MYTGHIGNTSFQHQPPNKPQYLASTPQILKKHQRPLVPFFRDLPQPIHGHIIIFPDTPPVPVHHRERVLGLREIFMGSPPKPLGGLFIVFCDTLSLRKPLAECILVSCLPELRSGNLPGNKLGGFVSLGCGAFASPSFAAAINFKKLDIDWF